MVGVLEKFVDECKDIATVEQKPKMEGRQMFIMLAPINENNSLLLGGNESCQNENSPWSLNVLKELVQVN